MGDEAALGTVPQPQKVGHRVSELLTALTVVWWLYLHGEVGWISLGQELCGPRWMHVFLPADSLCAVSLPHSFLSNAPVGCHSRRRNPSFVCVCCPNGIFKDLFLCVHNVLE